ncbi:MAG: choice-of-anchor J domain-containing protein [Muribaculaceae bacterium]|nr:choice-of-anchor J domain-containing protein [Muribaculaceae bacterium]
MPKLKQFITLCGVAVAITAASATTPIEGGRVAPGRPTGSLSEYKTKGQSCLVPIRQAKKNNQRLMRHPGLNNNSPLAKKLEMVEHARMTERMKQRPVNLRQPKQLTVINREEGKYVPTLVGDVVYANSWDPDYPQTDLYAFRAEAPIEFSAPITRYIGAPNGGGVFYDNKFHFISYSSFVGIAGTYYCWDFDEGWITRTEDLPYNDTSLFAVDMTYDATDGKVYGICYNSTQTGYELATIDYDNLTKTSIATISPRLVCLAADAGGQLYGIRPDGDLYKVNKTNGELTFVGSTGLGGANFMQSATIDPRNGKMYWCYYSDKESALYEVDLSSAKATKIGDFPDGEEVVAVYVQPAKYSDHAPAAVSDFNVDLDGPSTNVGFSFTLPSVTIQDKTLTGTLGYEISANGEVICTGTGTPGQQINVKAESPDEEINFEVVALKDGDKGPAVFCPRWVGYDYPSMVWPVSCERIDDTVYFDWTGYVPEPDRGGYLKPEDVVYIAKVNFEGEILAVDTVPGPTYSYKLDLNRSGFYNIDVQADNHGKQQFVSVFVEKFGDINLPFVDYFGDAWGNDTWNPLQLGNDFSSWGITGDCARLWFSVNTDPEWDMKGDNWFMTPSFKLEKGRQYRISFDYNFIAEDAEFTINLGSALGKPADFKPIWTADQRMQDETFVSREIWINPETSGSYRIGLRGMNKGYGKDDRWIQVDNFRIEEGRSPLMAAAPTEFSVIPDPHSLKATVSMKAPTLDAKGNRLSKIEKVVVTRNDSIAHEFTSVTPGATLSYVDEGDPGVARYMAYAVTDQGEGAPAAVVVFLGIDAPESAENVVLKESDDKMTLSWTAPKFTKFGDALQSGDLWYRVIRADMNEMVDAFDRIKECQVIDNLDTTSDPHPIQYSVVANTVGGEAEAAFAPARAVGRTMPLPFCESFNNGFDQEYWWHLTMLGSTFYPAQGLSTDGDDWCGMLEGGWLGFEDAWLSTPKLDVANAKNPVFLLDYVVLPGESEIHVQLVTSSKNQQTIHEDFFKEAKQPEWRRIAIPLKPYLKAEDKFAVIQVQGTVLDMEDFIAIDNFRVIDARDNDVQISAISVPSELAVNAEGRAVVTLANNGTVDLPNGVVQLYIDGEKRGETKINGVSAFGTMQVSVPFTAYSSENDELSIFAEYVNSRDIDVSNNKSDSYMVKLVKTDYPAPENLSVVDTEEGLRLEWSEPSVELGGDMVEGFENYQTFLNSDLGGWITLDRDGLPTYSVQSLSWPNAGAPSSFMVFNLDDCNSAENINNYYREMRAYEGNKCLISMSAEEGKSNDWLISPELSGEAQEISFMAKTYTEIYGLERLEVLVSFEETTKKSPKLSSFESLDTLSLPCVWTEYKFKLPEGAKYFALKNVTTDGYMMMIDNISFSSRKQPVNSYRFYRDGLPLNTTTDLFALDIPSEGLHRYNVSAIYAYGESPLSNTVTIWTSSVNDNAVGSLSVRGVKGAIEIFGGSGAKIVIGDMTGMTIWSSECVTSERVSLSPGAYIVMIDDRSFKVLVK